jgi:hypothetical protein
VDLSFAVFILILCSLLAGVIARNESNTASAHSSYWVFFSACSASCGQSSCGRVLRLGCVRLPAADATRARMFRCVSLLFSVGSAPLGKPSVRDRAPRRTPVARQNQGPIAAHELAAALI